MHVHGDDGHVHLQKTDAVGCRECGWEGPLTECTVSDGVLFATLYLCPNKLPCLLVLKRQCRTPLALFGEEGGLRTLERGRRVETAPAAGTELTNAKL